MSNFIVSLLVPTLYLGSATAIAMRLFTNPVPYPARELGLSIGAAGVLLHTALFYHTLITPEGINFGFFNALSLVIWTVLVMLLISSLNKPVENLGIALFPLGASIIWLERLFPTMHFMSQTATWGLKIHILVSLLAYSFLTLATVQSVLLAIQDQHLHARHPGGFIRALPPLQTMEKLLFEMIGAGFILLTLSLASGFIFLEDMFAQHLAHKTILSVFGWLLFGTLLVGRFRSGWRGRTVIIWTISGFIVLMVAYFGTKAVLELVLNRH